MKDQGNCVCQCVVNCFQSKVTCFLWVFQAFAIGLRVYLLHSPVVGL
jgi:hypothetical protein